MFWDLKKRSNDLECFRKFLSSQIKIPILVVGIKDKKNEDSNKKERENLIEKSKLQLNQDIVENKNFEDCLGKKIVFRNEIFL